MRYLALLLLTGCMAAPSSELRTPNDPAPAHVDWTLRVDTEGRKLGSYTLVIRFNPEVAHVVGIQGSLGDFEGKPVYDPGAFSSGCLRVAGVDPFPSSGPPPHGYPLFAVTFRRASRGMLHARVEIEKLYDENDKPLPGKVLNPPLDYFFP